LKQRFELQHSTYFSDEGAFLAFYFFSELDKDFKSIRLQKGRVVHLQTIWVARVDLKKVSCMRQEEKL
jgi:hypothetical protein